MRHSSAQLLALGLALLPLLATACERPNSDDSPRWSTEQLSVLLTMSLPTQPPVSPSNRYADQDQTAQLGRKFFFDPGLSRDGSISCASCHKPSLYFTDGQPTAVGIQSGSRHTPSVLGVAAFPFTTWDGRTDSLWSQALVPLENPEEMGSHRLLVLRHVARRYGADYERVFGPLPALPEGLEALEPDGVQAFWESLDPADREQATGVFMKVGKAIEAYERRLCTDPAPFDEFIAALRCGDATGGGHLSPAALRGLKAFMGEANCINCHNGPLFTDLAFHNLGLPSAKSPRDAGRSEGISQLLLSEFRSDGPHADDRPNPRLAFANPGFADALGAFKTPSLRNVAKTAPYGHAGQFENLDELLESYRQKRPPAAVGHLDPLLGLVSREFSVPDMRAFLESLTGPPPSTDLWSAEAPAADGESLH